MRDNGQIDLFLEVLTNLSSENETFKIEKETFTFLKGEFIMMGHETLQKFATKWIDTLQVKLKGVRFVFFSFFFSSKSTLNDIALLVRFDGFFFSKKRNASS